MPFKYDPDNHYRKSIRLKGYDYSRPGAYFISIVTENRECLFGDVIDCQMVLNKAGELVRNIWEGLQKRFSNMELDAYVVMPNHIHGIICVVERDEAALASKSKKPTLGEIIRVFKSISAIEVNKILGRQGKSLWQQNYYDHVIRDEKDLDSRRKYIMDNPGKWAEDKEHN
jgi:putative transposase